MVKRCTLEHAPPHHLVKGQYPAVQTLPRHQVAAAASSSSLSPLNRFSLSPYLIGHLYLSHHLHLFSPYVVITTAVELAPRWAWVEAARYRAATYRALITQSLLLNMPFPSLTRWHTNLVWQVRPRC